MMKENESEGVGSTLSQYELERLRRAEQAARTFCSKLLDDAMSDLPEAVRDDPSFCPGRRDFWMRRFFGGWKLAHGKRTTTNSRSSW